MILPMTFGLEQFLEMTKVLKHVEDRYKRPPYNQYNRHEPSKQGNNANKENQQPNSLMQSTSQTSQHSQITRNMQIGNISMKQIATIGLRSRSSSGSTGRCISVHLNPQRT